VAQSTVRLIVDAQNAISPLKRVNEQTKALSTSTDKLKGRLDRSNRSLRDTGRAAKTASTGVATLTKTFAPLLAAVSVLGSARFVFFKTAELETQRASLKQLTGSLEKTNKIISDLQEFGAVTPFTSAELIEQTKRLKAFGFETEELVDTTKRLSDVAGATGADLTGIATAFGQIRAKGKLQQEENLQLLERGVDITTELKRITGLQGDAFEKAQRQGKIGADLVNKALINLTNEGGAFFGGATAQAETLNGKLSTLQDTIDTLARTIGTELEDEIKSVLDFSIKAVKTVDKLIKNFSILEKAIDVINPFEQIRSLQQQLDKEEEITETFIGRPTIQNEIIKNNQEIIKNLEKQLNLLEPIEDKFMKIGESVEQGIVSNLTDAVMGTQTLAQAAIGVLNNLKRKLVELAIQQAVSGIGGRIGGFLGNIFGKRANGGPVSAGGAYLVGERGPEILQMGSRGGNIIPNNAIGGGGTTNMITVNVDATGSSVEGNGSEADQLGGLIASVVQATIIDEQRAGGLLNR
tara:strand:- start:2610 stop:4178 length:1569 start_codon:yes stop_codon:yes gene_type:complete